LPPGVTDHGLITLPTTTTSPAVGEASYDQAVGGALRRQELDRNWRPSAEGDHYFRVWGRRRALRTAEEIIGDYKTRGVPDFEVAIFQTRDDAMRWYFSTDRERDGLPPLEGRIESRGDS
jgi:hypothetical protein